MNNNFLDPIITGTIASGVELMDAIVLNGQVHNKATMAPRPLQFIPIPSLSNEFFASNMLFWKGIQTVHSLAIKDNLFLDSTNPNISYFIRQAPKQTSLKPVLVKIITNADKTYSFEEYPFGGTDRFSIQYLTQDTNNIYCILYTSYAYVHITRLRKDFSKADVYVNAQLGNDIRGDVILYSENPTNLTFITQYVSASGIKPLRALTVNKTNMTVVEVASLTAAEYGVSSPIPSMRMTPPIDGRCYYVAGNDDDPLGLNYLTLDESTKELKVFNVNITIQAETRSLIRDLKQQGITVDIKHFKDLDKSYLMVMVYNNTNWYNITNMTLSKIHIFELTSANEAILRQTIQLDNWYRGILSIDDNKTHICINEGGVVFYAWDSDSKKLEQTYILDGDYHQIAVDKLNNIYAVNEARTAVKRMSQGIPAGVAEITFDKQRYAVKIGEKQHSKIYISLKNYMGKYLSRNLKVSLYGNCEFEDGTTENVVITDPNKPLEKIILITGPGELYAVPTII